MVFPPESITENVDAKHLAAWGGAVQAVEKNRHCKDKKVYGLDGRKAGRDLATRSWQGKNTLFEPGSGLLREDKRVADNRLRDLGTIVPGARLAEVSAPTLSAPPPQSRGIEPETVSPSDPVFAADLPVGNRRTGARRAAWPSRRARRPPAHRNPPHDRSFRTIRLG